MFKIDRVNSSMLCMVRGKLCITIATAFTVTMATHMLLFMMFIDRQLINSVSSFSPTEDRDGAEFYDGNLKIKSIHKRHISAELDGRSRDEFMENRNLYNDVNDNDQNLFDNINYGKDDVKSIQSSNDKLTVHLVPNMDNMNAQRKILGNTIVGESNNDKNLLLSNSDSSNPDTNDAQTWVGETFHRIKSKILKFHKNVYGNSYKNSANGEVDNNNELYKDHQSNVQSAMMHKSSDTNNKVVPDLLSQISDTQYSSDSENAEHFKVDSNNNVDSYQYNHNIDDNNIESINMKLQNGMILLNAQNMKQKDISALISKVDFQEINISPNKQDDEWEPTDDWSMEHLIVAIKPSKTKTSNLPTGGKISNIPVKDNNNIIDNSNKKTLPNAITAKNDGSVGSIKEKTSSINSNKVNNIKEKTSGISHNSKLSNVNNNVIKSVQSSHSDNNKNMQKTVKSAVPDSSNSRITSKQKSPNQRTDTKTVGNRKISNSITNNDQINTEKKRSSAAKTAAERKEPVIKILTFVMNKTNSGAIITEKDKPRQNLNSGSRTAGGDSANYDTHNQKPEKRRTILITRDIDQLLKQSRSGISRDNKLDRSNQILKGHGKT